MVAKRVYVKDIAMFIADKGLVEAIKKFGEIKPRRAREIVEIMNSTGVSVPEELQDIADRVRSYGHRQPPPRPGEERDYMSTENARVSVNVSVIGIGGRQPARVKYHEDKIVVTKPSKKLTNKR